MKNSTYFKFVGELPNEAAGREALSRGRGSVRRNDSRRIHPPAAAPRAAFPARSKPTPPTQPRRRNAIFALNGIVQSVIQKELTGPLAPLGWHAAALRCRSAPPLQP